MTIQEQWTVETLKHQIKTLQANPQQELAPESKSHPVINRLEKIETQIQAITPQKMSKLSQYQRQQLLTTIKRMEKILQAKRSELSGTE